MFATTPTSFASLLPPTAHTDRQFFPGMQSLPSQAPTATGTDRVELSALALQRSRETSIVDLFDPAYRSQGRRKYKTLSEVGQDFQADYAAYQDLLGGVLQTAGIDLSPPLVLQPDLKGSIRTVNDHPEAATVNSMFKDGSPLISRFMVMAARASLMDAAASEPGFQADYEENPPAAIRAHIDALEERLGGFQLRVGENGFDFNFA